MENPTVYKLDTRKWYIERTVYLLAGIFILLAVALSLIVNEKLVYLVAPIGMMMTIFALTGYCPLSILLEKLGMERGITADASSK